MSFSYPIKTGLFSRVIKAEDNFVIEPDQDIQITGVCINGDIKDDKRSVLCMKYEDDPESLEVDEEINSDEAESDEEGDKEPATGDDGAQVNGEPKFQAVTVLPMYDGDDSDEEMEGEEEKEAEEDDGEESEDESFAQPLVIRQMTVAALTPHKTEQVSVDLYLHKTQSYQFQNFSANDICISGSYIFIPGVDDSDSDDSEYDSDEEELLEDEFGLYDPETGLVGGEITDPSGELLSSGEDSEDEEEVADDADRFEELKDSPQKQKAAVKAAPKATKATKAEKAVPVEAVTEDADVSMASATPSEKLSKNQLKKLKKAAKKAETNGTVPESASVEAPAVETAAKSKEAVPTKKPSKRVTLPSGLTYFDAKEGKGPVAKKGSKVSMRYIGKLDDGKVFDSNTSGQAFSFVLGTGEVIKGWDQGIVGMAVGGERKLTIPANLAYGKKGTDGIPGNAQLTFDVKLLGIK